MHDLCLVWVHFKKLLSSCPRRMEDYALYSICLSIWTCKSKKFKVHVVYSCHGKGDVILRLAGKKVKEVSK